MGIPIPMHTSTRYDSVQPNVHNRQLLTWMMSRSEKWLPFKSKVNSSSYVWHIENFSKRTFDSHHQYRYSHERDEVRSVVKYLRSPSFELSFTVCGSPMKAYSMYLWLMRDAEEHRDGSCTYTSPWLRLGLGSEYTREPPTDFGAREQTDDSRNIFTVWISGKRRECVTRLTGSSFLSMVQPEFVLYDDLFDKEAGLVCDDRLTIVIEVHAFADDLRHVNSWLFDPVEPHVVHRREHTLANDLRRMLNTETGSDITLVANDGEEFPAHSLILASRSPVFAAMFEHDMKEKKEKRVIIDDLSSEVVASLLEFVYTDSVTNFTTLAPELLPAAHKYDISRMKTMCEEALLAELNTENAAELLLLAELYEADQLRTAAKRFVLTNLYEVKQTEGWKKRQHQLSEKVIDEFAELMRQLTSA